MQFLTHTLDVFHSQFLVPAESTSTTIQPSMTSTASLITISTTKSTLQPTPIQAGLSPVYSHTNTNPHTTGIIAGAIVAAIFVLVIISTAIFVVVVLIARRKPKKQVNQDSDMIGNLAYETSQRSDTPRYSDYHAYDYPQLYPQLLSPSEEGKVIDTQEAKASTETRPCTTYIMNMAAQRNEAYGTSLNSSLDKLEYSYVQYC